MSPLTHFLCGWIVASAAELNPRDRALVTWASVIPDIDGFGLPFEALTRTSAHPITWWSDYHHVLGHNIGFAIVTAIAAGFLARQKWPTTLLVFFTFHLHLIGDLAGARGPDGHQWPIPYLLPFSNGAQWVWKGQWALNAWPNFVLTAIFARSDFLLGVEEGPLSAGNVFSAG